MSLADVEDRVARALAALMAPGFDDLDPGDVEKYLAGLAQSWLDPAPFEALSAKIEQYSDHTTETFIDGVASALGEMHVVASKSSFRFGVRNAFFSRYVVVDEAPPMGGEGHRASAPDSTIQVYQR